MRAVEEEQMISEWLQEMEMWSISVDHICFYWRTTAFIYQNPAEQAFLSPGEKQLAFFLHQKPDLNVFKK